MKCPLEKRKLEVCVDSVESALAAKAGGADRLELCSNLIIGGTTPSVSLLRMVKEKTGLCTHVLLRPRFGDFLYSQYTYAQMLDEAEALLEAGADGIVSGVLTEEGDLDEARTGKLVRLAKDKGRRFTLHRAFDMCRDPFETLAQCEAMGVDLILTSGQKNSCVAGLPLLKQLTERLDKVTLLFGAGIHAEAIRQIRRGIPKAAEFHMSGKKILDSRMQYRKDGVNMGLPGMSEYEIWETDETAIRLAKEALKA